LITGVVRIFTGKVTHSLTGVAKIFTGSVQSQAWFHFYRAACNADVV